jgi:hypothetical protein
MLIWHSGLPSINLVSSKRLRSNDHTCCIPVVLYDVRHRQAFVHSTVRTAYRLPLTRTNARPTFTDARTNKQPSDDEHVVAADVNQPQQPKENLPNPLQRFLQLLATVFHAWLPRFLPSLQHRKRLAAGLSLLFVSALMIGAGIAGVTARAPHKTQAAPKEVSLPGSRLCEGWAPSRLAMLCFASYCYLWPCC